MRPYRDPIMKMKIKSDNVKAINRGWVVVNRPLQVVEIPDFIFE